MADKNLSANKSANDRVRHQKIDVVGAADKDVKNVVEKKTSRSKVPQTETDHQKSDRDMLQSKLSETLQMLKDEQKQQEDSVREYLRLSADANNAQLLRIKSLFEKRNQKSTQNIMQLQAKVEMYRSHIRELNSVATDTQKKNVGQGFKKIVSKPIEHLKTKLGSSDTENGSKLASDENRVERSSSIESNVDSDSSTKTAEKVYVPSRAKSSRWSEGLLSLFSPQVRFIESTLHDIQEEQQRLSSAITSLRTKMLEDYRKLEELLEVERDICDRIEEQINDLSDLHQNEMTNIKQELASVEEKVLYQVDQKTQDLQSQLDSCEFRVNKIELQQSHQQQMQVENSQRSTISVGALFNLIIYLVSLLLILLHTMFGLLSPFMTTRLRYFTTFFVVLSSTLIWYNWNLIHPTIKHWISA